jgi:hypothetical protein
LPPQSIAHKLASAPARLLAESVKELFQLGVQANGHGRPHVLQRTTKRLFQATRPSNIRMNLTALRAARYPERWAARMAAVANFE